MERQGILKKQTGHGEEREEFGVWGLGFETLSRIEEGLFGYGDFLETVN